jgi:hypothetical protein
MRVRRSSVDKAWLKERSGGISATGAAAGRRDLVFVAMRETL